MTWLLRLACLGCLAGCCTVAQPLWTGVLAVWALAFGLLSEFTRSDVCWCGDIKDVHGRPGSGCGCPGCPCREFRRVWTRRTL